MMILTLKMMILGRPGGTGSALSSVSGVNTAGIHQSRPFGCECSTLSSQISCSFPSFLQPNCVTFTQVEEDTSLLDADEIAPQMDHSGRVLYKRYMVPTHSGALSSLDLLLLVDCFGSICDRFATVLCLFATVLRLVLRLFWVYLRLICDWFCDCFGSICDRFATVLRLISVVFWTPPGWHRCVPAVSNNNELCIKNEEFCIKNTRNFVLHNDEFRRMAGRHFLSGKAQGSGSGCCRRWRTTTTAVRHTNKLNNDGFCDKIDGFHTKSQRLRFPGGYHDDASGGGGGRGVAISFKMKNFEFKMMDFVFQNDDLNANGQVPPSAAWDMRTCVSGVSGGAGGSYWR